MIVGGGVPGVPTFPRERECDPQPDDEHDESEREPTSSSRHDPVLPADPSGFFEFRSLRATTRGAKRFDVARAQSATCRRKRITTGPFEHDETALERVERLTFAPQSRKRRAVNRQGRRHLVRGRALELELATGALSDVERLLESPSSNLDVRVVQLDSDAVLPALRLVLFECRQNDVARFFERPRRNCKSPSFPRMS